MLRDISKMSLEAEFMRHELGVSTYDIALAVRMTESRVVDFLMCRDGVYMDEADRIFQYLKRKKAPQK